MNFAIAASLFSLCFISGPPTVTMNGKTISKNVKVISGKPYISLEDMARGLGMTVQKTAAGYKLIAAGGANAISARNEGIIGDEIFTGEWRFKVLRVSIANEYKPVHTGEDYTYGPKGENNTLVIVDCRFKNGRPAKELIEFCDAVGKPTNAALVDTEEHNYEPYVADVKLDYYKYAVHILPGAAVDFALAFIVPKGTTPKDLIFWVHRYDDARSKRTAIRIHLKS